MTHWRCGGSLEMRWLIVLDAVTHFWKCDGSFLEMLTYLLTWDTWEMILVDPGRTPKRMFWLCDTFSCSSSPVHGVRHCCLGVPGCACDGSLLEN